MNVRLLASLALGLVTLACSGPGQDEAADGETPVVAASPATLHGEFVLSRIDFDGSPERCGDWPYHSRIELRDSTWSTTDSVHVDCAVPVAERTPVATTQGGTFARRGDTLDFLVSGTTTGLHGLVGRVIVQGDTLLLATEAHGDWRYGRR